MISSRLRHIESLTSTGAFLRTKSGKLPISNCENSAPLSRMTAPWGQMISLKKYLDQAAIESRERRELGPKELLPAAIAAYRSALLAMGSCSLNVCPNLGEELQQSLRKLAEGLSYTTSLEAVEFTDKSAREQLRTGARARPSTFGNRPRR